jgi:hypothetical protein
MVEIRVTVSPLPRLEIGSGRFRESSPEVIGIITAASPLRGNQKPPEI